VKRYLLIGPANAGKTALVASLTFAVRRAPQVNGFEQVGVQPRTPELIELSRTMMDTLRLGSIPFGATTTLTEHRFTLSTLHRARRWWGAPRAVEERYQFRMIDGPGGGVFGQVGGGGGDVDFAVLQECRERLIQEARAADGLAICLSAVDPAATHAIFADLPAFLDQALLEEPSGRLRMDRVAICLTKIDAWSARQRHGREALARVQRACPLELARRVLPRDTFSVLRTKLKPEATVGFGLASTFGYVQSEGVPNFNPTTGGLLVDLEGRPDPEHVYDTWRPFRCAEPFLFLATGHRGNMRAVRAGDLR